MSDQKYPWENVQAGGPPSTAQQTPTGVAYGASPVAGGIDYAALDAALGEDERSMRDRVLLPESYYPVQLQVAGYGGSSQKGTPELELFLTVTEGPCAGVELSRYDTRVYLTPGGAESKGGMIGKVRHMVHQVTGKYPDASVYGEYGFRFSGDLKAAQSEFHQQFNALTPDQQVAFMAKYARIREWDGKQVICFLAIEVDKTPDPRTGEVRSRNRIGNFYGMQHPQHGLNVVRTLHFPQQEQELRAREAQQAGG